MEHSAHFIAADISLPIIALHKAMTVTMARNSAPNSRK
jgi:hypothetical protein